VLGDFLSDYDYELPEDRIAQAPLEDRAGSRLLWLNPETGQVSDRSFRDITRILRAGDLLVLNETRVTARRLVGNRTSGGKIEALILRELETGLYEALMRPGKRLKKGATVRFQDGIEGAVEEDLGEGLKALRLVPATADLSRIGSVPLPPYIRRGIADQERYQTVYAQRGGSAAAPTAGLHFTQQLLGELRRNGIETASVSLDVSLDTFRPVQSERLDEHRMYGESCRIPPETAERIAKCRGRIVAVGTTSVRTLETMAEGRRRVRAGETVSRLFIRPGYEFQVIDGMFTNFHLPKTSMLMMISALCGREPVLRAYAHALAGGYRFLSFGDSMLILPGSIESK
jgi:S-adenosylmethionine:tRNA ribosyltransferase-isomerase